MPAPPTMSSTTTTLLPTPTPTNSTTTAAAAPKPPSNLHKFLAAPTPFLARVLYNSLPARPREPPHNHHQNAEEALTVVCVSDTHGQMPPLPAGDLLLHSGDLTASGSLAELQATLQWIAQQPHRYKVVIAGNRDLCLDGESASRGRSLAQDDKSTASATTCTKSKTAAATIDWEKLSAAGLVHLQNSSITLHFPAPRDRCVKIFGSPLSPLHAAASAAAASAATAFQYTSAENPWPGLIPPDTDIVLTHTPPQCHLDSWRRLGCGALLRELWRVRPALHVFGHVHAGYGAEVVRWDEMQRLYEVACAGAGAAGGGSTVWALVKMAGLFVVCWASHGLFGGRWCWGDGQGETRMVNASASRGRGAEADPQRMNEPIVVRL